MCTYENTVKSLIRSICQEFYDKLPSNMDVLKTLPVYAEKVIKNYIPGDTHTKQEINNQYNIWKGFVSVYKDTCTMYKVGDEILERGYRLDTLVSGYLQKAIDVAHPNRGNREKYLPWLFDWLSELDYHNLTIRGLTVETVDCMFRLQKTVNDVVNDILATCHAYDLNTANMINVFRDEDILIDVMQSYEKFICYLQREQPEEYQNFIDTVEGTAFESKTLWKHIREFINQAKGTTHVN